MTDRIVPAPHLPATCPECFARCSPYEQRIAVLVLKLLMEHRLDERLVDRYYMPKRTPLCEQVAHERQEANDG